MSSYLTFKNFNIDFRNHYSSMLKLKLFFEDKTKKIGSLNQDICLLISSINYPNEGLAIYYPIVNNKIWWDNYKYDLITYDLITDDLKNFCNKYWYLKLFS